MLPSRITSLHRIRRFFGRCTLRPMLSRRRRRPSFAMLEVRVVPAFNLTITTNLTAGVGVVTASGIRTFTANASGANININDIRTALVTDDVDVAITTGDTG